MWTRSPALVVLLGLSACAPLLQAGELGPSGYESGTPSADPSRSDEIVPPGRPCMIDADGVYKACLVSNAFGNCLRFGAPCSPVDMVTNPPCMRDPADGTFKDCRHVTVMGECDMFGGFCVP
jgi:hypothetical protein